MKKEWKEKIKIPIRNKLRKLIEKNKWTPYPSEEFTEQEIQIRTIRCILGVIDRTKI